MAFPQLVRTERLVLRRWDAALHTESLAGVNADPEAMRYLNGGVPFSREESSAQSLRFAAHWDRYGFGLWAVEATDAVVGFTGACHPLWFPAYADEVEVGWRLHPSAWGKGYATEAGRAAVGAALDHLDLARVIACIDPGNHASIAVADRLGMQPAETVAGPDGRGDITLYELR